jgi:hypothetical protein
MPLLWAGSVLPSRFRGLLFQPWNCFPFLAFLYGPY